VTIFVVNFSRWWTCSVGKHKSNHFGAGSSYYR